ncbi:hypothetical protein [Solitalea lacus]|uniref:hypothetical protein n=1 Tax=Solitalea lacus TaxID=2911172 RepID=UPI001EDC7E6A|nr:hypothetical protein [Solitalea lacus]UKJ06892.1 hypothetical protein L2B55_15335 [Solitalea lacus]
MSQLSDKDFDKLLSDAFEGFTEEPSTKVWMAIENDLDRQRVAGKKMRLAQWSIAASVVLCLISAGLYFSDKHQLNGQEVAGVIDNKDPNPEKETRNRAVTILSPKTHTAEPSPVKSEVKDSKPAQKKSGLNSKEKAKASQAVVDGDTRIAQVSNTETLRPHKAGTLPTDNCVPDLQPKLLHQALIASENPEGSKEIPTIGDALNYIAAKVDKRDKKFMAFKKSSGFSVNLGVVKIERKLQSEEEEKVEEAAGR